MSTSDRIDVMSSEDGDRWYAEGHHSDEAMLEAAARLESESMWRAVHAEDFSHVVVFRGWLRPINPDDDESPMHPVNEGDPGAQAWTILDAELDWESIDRRPERRPEWAERKS